MAIGIAHTLRVGVSVRNTESKTKQECSLLQSSVFAHIRYCHGPSYDVQHVHGRVGCCRTAKPGCLYIGEGGELIGPLLHFISHGGVARRAPLSHFYCTVVFWHEGCSANKMGAVCERDPSRLGLCVAYAMRFLVNNVRRWCRRARLGLARHRRAGL